MPGRQPLNYFICTGLDPSLDPNRDLVKVNHVYNFVTLMSIVIQTIVAVKISVHKIKVERETGVKGNSLVSDVLTCLGFLLVSGNSAFFLYKVNSLGEEKIKVYPYYLYLYGLHLLTPVIVGVTFCTLLYSRNSSMRTAIFKEIKDFHKNQLHNWSNFNNCNVGQSS
jgi:hypothetical protein